MKRTALICAALMVMGFLAPVAQAQICIDFINFCDGLEIQLSEDNFSGIWRNRHCDVYTLWRQAKSFSSGERGTHKAAGGRAKIK